MEDDTYSMSDDLGQNNTDKLYICLSEATNRAKYLVEGNNIVGLFRAEGIFIREKQYLAKEMRESILASHLTAWDT